MTLFKAINELLINVIKHSQANEAKVTICRHENMIKIIIEDDGIGIDIARSFKTADESGGFGLFNIRERLKYIGGEFYICMRSPKGTCARLSAPLNL